MTSSFEGRGSTLQRGHSTATQPFGEPTARAPAGIGRPYNALRAMLLLALLAVAPAARWPPPTPSVTPLVVPAPGAAQPALHGAPTLKDVPLGQRLRTEQDCGSCHRIEDRRQAPAAAEVGVMT